MLRVETGSLAAVFAAGLVALAVSLPAAARAQGPPQFDVEAQRKAMAKLDYMIGDWRGSGWMDRGGRQTFAGGERVQRKLDGLALLVEGDFAASTDPGRSVHKTLGVIYFDPATKTYRFDTWLAMGSRGQHELELLDDGWRWHIKTPMGTMRYTMRRGTNGEWLEIGERSSDDTRWTQFFEMSLQKHGE